MTREEAIYRLKNTAWLGTDEDREHTEQALDMAIEALSADAVSREDWSNLVAEYNNTIGAIMAVISAPTGIKEISDHFAELIKEEQTELVRCKDCRHNETRTVLNHGVNEPSCTFTKKVLTENDYCSFGERAESKDKYIRWCAEQEFDKYDFSKSITESSNDVIESANDVIAVVRCKDCRHAHFKDFDKYCPYMVGALKPNQFCSHGERADKVSCSKCMHRDTCEDAYQEHSQYCNGEIADQTDHPDFEINLKNNTLTIYEDKGGDAEMKRESLTTESSPYMQQSRHDDGRIEVVRCKDCKHLEVINTENTYAICHEHDIIFEPFEDSTTTNYCSWGERREP